MKTIFIAGTDTGVGKTIVAGLLGRYLIENGHSVVTQKWVQTGAIGFSQDINAHLKLMRKKKKEFKNYFSSMMPYTFKFAAAPHLASRLEKRAIKIHNIQNSLKKLTADFDFVIVEGTGGLLVPLDGEKLLIDVVKALGLPALLVAENSLGAINHTLLSIESMQSRDIKIVGIIFNNISEEENELILMDNPRTVKKLTAVDVLGILPCANKMDNLYRRFIPIGKKIADRL